MGIRIRKSGDRGYFNHGWLKTFHTFSFAQYDDPEYRGYHSLKIMNENYVQPGTGYPVQTHHDMEIFSIVLSGGISHQDDLGNASILRPGHIQLLSTGKGMTHTAYNASDKEAAHFWQVWMTPIDRQLKPSYQEKFFSLENQHNQLNLIISSNGRDGSLHIHQNCEIYLSTLEEGKELHYELAEHRYGWIQILEGELKVNEVILEEGDGASISEIKDLNFKALTFTQFLYLYMSSSEGKNLNSL